MGINAVKFCKEFNEITVDLPNYFKLTVVINYYENNSYDIIVNEPCIGYIISLLKFPINLEDDINGLFYIKLDEVIRLALFKWPGMPLNKSLPIAISNVEGAGLVIFDKNFEKFLESEEEIISNDFIVDLDLELEAENDKDSEFFIKDENSIKSN